MPIRPFPTDRPTPTPPTKEQLTARAVLQIENTVARCGGMLLNSYQSIMGLIHANPDGLTSAEIYTALGAENEAALQKFAIGVKALVNDAEPGKIVDAVPQATITV